VVAALIALAGFLHAHVVAVILLAAMVAGALLVIAYDAGKEKGASQTVPVRSSSSPGSPFGSIVAGSGITAGGEIRATGDVAAGAEISGSHPASWLAPATLGS